MRAINTQLRFHSECDGRDWRRRAEFFVGGAVYDFGTLLHLLSGTVSFCIFLCAFCDGVWSKPVRASCVAFIVVLVGACGGVVAAEEGRRHGTATCVMRAACDGAFALRVAKGW